MALQSRLFRGESKLEAAAASDPSHILPGTIGAHVGKIQLALIKLDGAVMAQTELRRFVYGASTAAAVLAYKRERSIVNRSYQTQADNIVGKMTMARLDAEMLALEAVASGSPSIVPIAPTPRLVFTRTAIAPPISFAQSRFGFGPSAPPQPQIIPGGPTLQMKIPGRGIGVFQVVNGIGETVSCDDNDVGAIFDPDDPSNDGVVFIEKDPHVCKVRGGKPGATSIAVTRSNSAGVPFGLVRIPLVVVPAAKSEFLHPEGLPINPRGTKRMLNIFGQLETNGQFGPVFEDFATDHHSLDPVHNISRPYTRLSIIPPGSSDRFGTPVNRGSPPDLPAGAASDICCRDSPLDDKDFEEIKRLAMPGCRITYTLGAEGFPKDVGADAKMKLMRKHFPENETTTREEGLFEGTFRGKPTLYKVLVVETR